MLAAVFLDRDGVIIENRDEYVRTWDDVAFIPGALDALARLSQTPYAIILVTNQSAVGRGILSLSGALELNHTLVSEVKAAGGRIDDTFLCPHAPWENCQCRKPRPGLLLQAAEKYALNLSRSLMVGDAVSDIIAGRSAGVGKSALVLTGRGKVQVRLEEAKTLQPFDVFPHLGGFVDHLLSGSLGA